MPKIIENLQQRLTAEARKQIEESGYSAVTIRSIAKGCGVGVGTVYNYFSSKDVLLAAYMLEDWNRCIAAIEAVSADSSEPAPVARCVHQQVLAFVRQQEAVFRDEAALVSFAGSFNRYHTMLRSQLAQPLRKFCDNDFTADFIAENLLIWTLAGKPFEEIYGILKKLF
jgi:AcrR family transcriptional regulator